MTLALATAAAGAEPITGLLFALASVLVGARLCGELASRLGQPPVLGELCAGIVLGNLHLAGASVFEGLAADPAFVVLAELGAILLLFHVGLESTLGDMLAVGGRATLVAVVGVAAPMVLGFGVGAWLQPGRSWMFHAFLGAMLAATSVGITARVLRDADALRTRAARIILGAAVIDDVLGLLVLAVVTGVIRAAASGETVAASALLLILVKAVVFLVGALVFGSYVVRRMFRRALVLQGTEVVLTLSLAFCFVLAALSVAAGLAPIVGAFAAGLVLEDVHFRGHVERGDHALHESLAPLIALFVPIFFVRMGMMVDLVILTRPGVVAFALALTLAAIVGKLCCALAVPRGVSPLVVGLGMMPRGEVGLIFAGIGAQLVLAGEPVIDTATYAAAILMVVATTMVTPPLLLAAMRRAGPEPE